MVNYLKECQCFCPPRDQLKRTILVQMSFSDLPQEILALVVQHIDPSDLPKSIDDLLVSRAWYRAVLPVYLSRLQLSTIYVLSNDLERFPRPDTNPLLSQAIQKTVTRLSLCLDGLPSRDRLSWDDQRELGEDQGLDTHQWLDQIIYYHRNGCSETLQERLKVLFADDKIQPRIRDEDDHWFESYESDIVYRDRFLADELEEARELESRLSNWRGGLNERVSRFAELLPGFEKLSEIKIETTLTPRWNYMFAASMGRLLTSLPSNVTTLTLDTHACQFTSEPLHICAILSQRLLSFQTVRIRMGSICPSILEKCINSPDSTSRLMNLVIRLYLPNPWGAVDIHYDRHSSIFDAKSCYSVRKPLFYKEMVLAGHQLAKARPSMTGVRIAFRPHGSESIVVADCKEEAGFHPVDRIIYKDGTLVEGPWEDSMELQRDRFSFTPLLPPRSVHEDLSVSLV